MFFRFIFPIIIIVIVFQCVLQRKEGGKLINGLRSRVYIADKQLEDKRYRNALEIYIELSREASSENESEIFAHIQNNIGICYYNLAKMSNSENNLIRAMWAYDEALMIYDIEEYPKNYAETHINLGDTYNALTEFEGNDECFEEAILSYEKALKIYTAEKHQIYYEEIMSKIEAVKQKIDQ